MKNLNYLFNTKYYDDVLKKGTDDLECYNRLFTQSINYLQGDNLKLPSEQCSELKTVYPGLLLGLGYAHEIAGDEKGVILSKEVAKQEIKLGFTLDYVTGLPIIPGSTVKGVLRSALRSALQSTHELDEKKLLEIFGKENGSSGNDEQGKVIFYDAIPVKADPNKKLFGLEYITPHYQEDDKFHGEFTNPIPLRLLKVLPEVTYLFRFGFDKWDDKTVSKEELHKQFKDILTIFGIGAKTNVGFGQLKDSHLSHLCKVPGCSGEAKMNKKTGKYYNYCVDHKDYVEDWTRRNG